MSIMSIFAFALTTFADVQSYNLYGVRLTNSFERNCRHMPFVVASNNLTTCKINASAKTIHFLGMINAGHDRGGTHWAGHPEKNKPRKDLLGVGDKIGDLKIIYADGTVDTIPLIYGATAWNFVEWQLRNAKEPFRSRPYFSAVLKNSLKLKEDDAKLNILNNRAYYFLSVKPRDKQISRVDLSDNPSIPGSPLLSGITLDSPRPTKDFISFGQRNVPKSEREFTIESYNAKGWSNEITALAKKLYNYESDLPENIELIKFPSKLNAAKIIFKAGKNEKNFADMLSCIWAANIIDIDKKFYANNGEFHESAKNAPYYGSYGGIGTWTPLGVYYNGIFSRCSDHFASLALRCINNPERITNYFKYCDKLLYYYRSDHDPKNGPPNPNLNINKYPTNAPPHWSFFMSNPGGYMPAGEINELHGDEETDGHGATIVGRWLAWRHLGAPTGGWFNAPRADVYGKSPWQASIDSAEFICWLLDYTKRDVVYSEGETTGWCGHGNHVLPGMADETNYAKIVQNYAKTDEMFQVYPSYVCMTALKCSAEMADAMGDKEKAKKWRKYAKRIRKGMTKELTVDYNGKPAWKYCSGSVYPAPNDSLVQAWFSIYFDGLDPKKFDPELTEITQNTFDRQLNQPWGHAQVFGMGYGQGWLTKTALILDKMDDAGILLTNLAKYSYDKNMNYVDKSRGIDWRNFQWIIPEGTAIRADGSWYRISDLGNGANQGIALHALELCAGIDDTNPKDLKIMPRVPAPLSGIEITDFPVLIPTSKVKGQRSKGLLTRALVNYSYKLKPLSFKLTSEKVLPTLSVRLGPFTKTEVEKQLKKIKVPKDAKTRIDKSGQYKKKEAYWIWIEGMKNIKTLNL